MLLQAPVRAAEFICPSRDFWGSPIVRVEFTERRAGNGSFPQEPNIFPYRKPNQSVGVWQEPITAGSSFQFECIYADKTSVVVRFPEGKPAYCSYVFEAGSQGEIRRVVRASCNSELAK